MYQIGDKVQAVINDIDLEGEVEEILKDEAGQTILHAVFVVEGEEVGLAFTLEGDGVIE